MPQNPEAAVTKDLLTPRDDIFVIRNFLTAEECDELVARTEGIGFGEATVNGPNGAFVNKGMRNNQRVILDDFELARQLWWKVREFVSDEQGFTPYGMNERFRFYRYEPGQFFDWHFDASFQRGRDDLSMLTFMIYLNGDCEGGTTDFHLGGDGQVRDDDPCIVKVKPEKGMALVFTHNVLHRGAEITSGKKYVVRSDVMYRR